MFVRWKKAEANSESMETGRKVFRLWIFENLAPRALCIWKINLTKILTNEERNKQTNKPQTYKQNKQINRQKSKQTNRQTTDIQTNNIFKQTNKTYKQTKQTNKQQTYK